MVLCAIPQKKSMSVKRNLEKDGSTNRFSLIDDDEPPTKRRRTKNKSKQMDPRCQYCDSSIHKENLEIHETNCDLNPNNIFDVNDDEDDIVLSSAGKESNNTNSNNNNNINNRMNENNNKNSINNTGNNGDTKTGNKLTEPIIRSKIKRKIKMKTKTKIKEQEKEKKFQQKKFRAPKMDRNKLIKNRLKHDNNENDNIQSNANDTQSGNSSPLAVVKQGKKGNQGYGDYIAHSKVCMFCQKRIARDKHFQHELTCPGLY